MAKGESMSDAAETRNGSVAGREMVLQPSRPAGS